MTNNLLNDYYLNAIRGFEGRTNRATWDYKQYSNGYGTKAQFAGEKISEAEACRRFEAEISEARSAVAKFAPGLEEGSAAALTSLTFNAGTAWMSSGLGAAIKAGDLELAKAIFVQYTNAGGPCLPGLVARRSAEVEWFGRQDTVASSNIASLESSAVAAPGSPSSNPNATLAPLDGATHAQTVGTSGDGASSPVGSTSEAALHPLGAFFYEILASIIHFSGSPDSIQQASR